MREPKGATGVLLVDPAQLVNDLETSTTSHGTVSAIFTKPLLHLLTRVLLRPVSLAYARQTLTTVVEATSRTSFQPLGRANFDERVARKLLSPSGRMYLLQVLTRTLVCRVALEEVVA